MRQIQHITKNRFCCHLRGHNTDEFRILIFEINIKTNQVNELGILKPKAQENGSGSPASGEIVVLSNGQLLTYHDCNDNVQIWDTETLECIKEWNWSDINKPADFTVWCLNIWSFPDSIHILVYQGNQMYLFNTDKLQLKQMEFPDKLKPDDCGRHQVLANGQILAFVCKDNMDSDHVKIFHFDLKEMIYFREKMTDYKVSKYISQLFLNDRLPAEMTDIIISNAFTSEVEKSVARKAYDDFDKANEKQNCIVM